MGIWDYLAPVPGGWDNLAAGSQKSGGWSDTDPAATSAMARKNVEYLNRGAEFQNPDEAANRDLLSQYYGSLGGRSAPDAVKLGPAANAGYGEGYGGATIDTGASDEARKYQMGLLGRLQDESMGKGPSLATETMKQGLAANLQQQAGLAGTQGAGGNPALAMRNLQMGAAQQNQQLLGQAGLARLQEQMAAQQQLGGLSSGMRAQDIGLAEQQAGLSQQAGLFSAGQHNQFSLANAGFGQQAMLAQGQMDNAYRQRQMELMGMTQQGQQWGLGQQLGMSEADRAAHEFWASQRQQGQQFNAGLNWQKQYAGDQRFDKYLGAGIGAAEGAAAAGSQGGGGDASGSGWTGSDVRTKTAIAPELTSSPIDAKTDVTDESSTGKAGMSFGAGDASTYETPVESTKRQEDTFASQASAPHSSAPQGGGVGGGVDWAKLGMTVGMLAIASDVKLKKDVKSEAAPLKEPIEFLNADELTPEEDASFNKALQKANYEQSVWQPGVREPMKMQPAATPWHEAGADSTVVENPALDAIKEALAAEKAKKEAAFNATMPWEYTPEELASRHGIRNYAAMIHDRPYNDRKSFYDGLLGAVKKKGGEKFLAAGNERPVSSDENAKKSVSESSLGASRHLLDPLKPYSYLYKDPDGPGAAHGRQLGVMAQDLERSPYAMDAVMDTPNGKMVDYAKLGPPMLAAESDLNKRVTTLEKMLEPRKKKKVA